MLDLPKTIIQVLRQFEGEFSERIWEWAKVLLIGAILSPGRGTVTEALRVMGLHNDPQFQNDHRVLNRAKWSSRALSRILVHLLVKIFVPTDAPIVVGIDETIERRRGAKIAAKDIYRDPVRSSKAFFVKTSGLRSRIDDVAHSHTLGEAECVPYPFSRGLLPPNAMQRIASVAIRK